MAASHELTLDQLRGMFRDRGVRRIYAKVLAPNDNSKNQIYLGGDFSALNVLPAGEPVAERDTGRDDRQRMKAAIDLRWLSPDGSLHRAPGAKLILYPQYPEVRLSGYLQGVDPAHRPSETMGTTRVAGRVLVLGVRDDRSILGFAATPDSAIAREVTRLRNPEQVGVFILVPMMAKAGDSRSALLEALCAASSRGWIASKRLDKHGQVKPYAAPNGGGYTLEAELGIIPNGNAEPDYLGWEVKQFGVGSFKQYGDPRITLMTPEPVGGVYASEGVIPFVERYGYKDLRGRPNRLNFGGTFYAGQREERTGLTLRLLGYDTGTGKITDVTGGIALIDDAGREAAVWRYGSLISHWNRKHASAAYVPSLSRSAAEGRQYRYSAAVQLGSGTTFEHFLASLDAAAVFYDPGIKVEAYPKQPKTKRRSQFRTKLKYLAALYDAYETANACGVRNADG